PEGPSAKPRAALPHVRARVARRSDSAHRRLPRGAVSRSSHGRRARRPGARTRSRVASGMRRPERSGPGPPPPKRRFRVRGPLKGLSPECAAHGENDAHRDGSGEDAFDSGEGEPAPCPRRSAGANAWPSPGGGHRMRTGPVRRPRGSPAGTPNSGAGFSPPLTGTSRFMTVLPEHRDGHMGRDVASVTISGEDRRRYREKVRRCLDVLARMLGESQFDFERPHIGLEIELNLIDAIGDPLMRNADVLKAIADPAWATELGQFNLEINIPPRELGGAS